MFAPAIAFVLLSGHSQNPLDPLEVKFKSAMAEKDFRKKIAGIEEVRAKAIGLINSKKLASASEFQRAGDLIGESTNDFTNIQIQYELYLSAVAGGDDSAKKKVGSTWDTLLVSMSRGRRLGLVDMKFKYGGEQYAVRPTAKAIIDTYSDPLASQKKAVSVADSAEVKALVDADQKARQGDWSKLTVQQIEKLAEEDASRLKRIKEIVFSGEIRTANDFDNAALVCQHGEVFEDYALAHELSVCAMLLGKKSASWLAGASYDRMLDHSGHLQRFATQYRSSNGSKFSLSKVDTNGICDAERLMVVHVSLAQAKNRKWD